MRVKRLCAHKAIALLTMYLILVVGVTTPASAQTGDDVGGVTKCVGPTNLAVTWIWSATNGTYQGNIEECDDTILSNYSIEAWDNSVLDEHGAPTVIKSFIPIEPMTPFVLEKPESAEIIFCPMYEYGLLKEITEAADQGSDWIDSLGSIGSCSTMFTASKDESQTFECHNLADDSGVVSIIDKSVTIGFTNGCIFPIYLDLDDSREGKLTLDWQRIDTNTWAEGEWAQKFYIYKYDDFGKAKTRVLNEKEVEPIDWPGDQSKSGTIDKHNYDNSPDSYGTFSELGRWQLTGFIGYKNSKPGTKVEGRFKDRSSGYFDRVISGGSATTNYQFLVNTEHVVSELHYEAKSSTTFPPSSPQPCVETYSAPDQIKESDAWVETTMKGKARNSALTDFYYATATFEFVVDLSLCQYLPLFAVHYEVERDVYAYVAGVWSQNPIHHDVVYQGVCQGTSNCTESSSNSIVLEGGWDPRVYEKTKARPLTQQAGGSHSPLYNVVYTVSWCSTVNLQGCTPGQKTESLSTEVLIV